MTKPVEILAPAGDPECLRAAVGAGADAVYFGLDVGFNARAKAKGFTPDELQNTCDYLHERGVKAYITFNTLVYDSELTLAADVLGTIAEAGADAVIVQDLGIARLARAIAPSLPIHASTQMTVSSAEGIALAAELGVKRVILPRELSVEEINRLRGKTSLELECFVHGALCVSYSGQCLTSEAWGQRSANRGQCAQSCRLPYDLVVDGEVFDTGVEKYLLSPKDLAAYSLLDQLVEAGISCFKIEGRYKGADYVAGTVEAYRKVLDGVLAGQRATLDRRSEEELQYTFSRGLSLGWLGGDDHQELSHGETPGHRGLLVGPVTAIRGNKVWIRPAADAPALKAGDWVVFEQGDPEGDEPRGGVFGVDPAADGELCVRFGDPGPDLSRVLSSAKLFKSHDPHLRARLLRYVDTTRRVPVDLTVRGAVGAPLLAEATDHFGRTAKVESQQPLAQASNAPLGEAVVRDKLGAFGQTRYALRELSLALDGALALPPAELKRMRRALVDALEAQPLPRQRHPVVGSLESLAAERAATAASAAGSRATASTVSDGTPQLVPLCRTLEQVDAALAVGVRELYLDFMELVGLAEAVRRCRAASCRVVIATMRIQKPGEEPIDKRLASLAPDGILARHLGALVHYRAEVEHGFALHGDFSLNASNVLTAESLLGMGLTTLTPSYDLNAEQLLGLAEQLPGDKLEVTLHQHLPLYHTEYCLYAHNLSDGKDFRDCGRPCESKRVSLRDGKGLDHPVLVDVGCRNTVFHAQAQSAARHFAALRSAGVRRFRAELVWETAAETRLVLESYQGLLSGGLSSAEVAKKLGAIERYGVTSGTLRVLRDARSEASA